jgi:hypothetical protein
LYLLFLSVRSSQQSSYFHLSRCFSLPAHCSLEHLDGSRKTRSVPPGGRWADRCGPTHLCTKTLQPRWSPGLVWTQAAGLKHSTKSPLMTSDRCCVSWFNNSAGGEHAAYSTCVVCCFVS